MKRYYRLLARSLILFVSPLPLMISFASYLLSRHWSLHAAEICGIAQPKPRLAFFMTHTKKKHSRSIQKWFHHFHISIKYFAKFIFDHRILDYNNWMNELHVNIQRSCHCDNDLKSLHCDEMESIWKWRKVCGMRLNLCVVWLMSMSHLWVYHTDDKPFATTSNLYTSSSDKAINRIMPVLALD